MEHDQPQLELGDPRVRARKAAQPKPPPPPEPPVTNPVARVVVETSLAHLDRTFDYRVPFAMSVAAVPGAAVRVRFAGVLTGGFVAERLPVTQHAGRLSPLASVVSPEPVLGPVLHRLCRTVADRQGGTLADVLRLAVPPRHARGEKGAPTGPPPEAPPAPARDAWVDHPRAGAFLDALAAGNSPRAVAVMGAAPWPQALAEAVVTTLAAGRGALVVVPDAKDLDRLDAALTTLAPGQHVTLSADLSAEQRWKRWVAVRRGAVRAVIGTRASAFAPVVDLGLAVVWDDGDDLHGEPRAPYPHVRDVLAVRSVQERCGLLVAGCTPSVEAVALTAGGWAEPLLPTRDSVRLKGPAVRASADGPRGAGRISPDAFAAARAAFAEGLPVLVQVPRRGYQASLACAQCRTPARCTYCAGPLARPSTSATPVCLACGRLAAGAAPTQAAPGPALPQRASGPPSLGAPPAGGGSPAPADSSGAWAWTCRTCGAHHLRAAVAGARRTAEELGRAFPGVPLVTSGRDGTVLPEIGRGASLVVCTPGAEPVGVYGAALLLDGWALLGRPDLRAASEALRRWSAAAALVAPGHPVVVDADAGVPAVQALVRGDPWTFAEREAADRTELHFPPAARIAAVVGDPDAVAQVVASVQAAGLDPLDVLGPVETDPGVVRTVLRVPRRQGAALAAATHAALAVRSARKDPGSARVRLDPPDVL